MARKLLEMESEEGGTILVAVDVPEGTVGAVSRADGDLLIEKVDRHFDSIRDLIVRGCRPLNEAFQDLSKHMQVSEAEVEFGVNFTAKGTVYVVESTGAASLKVKVTWSLKKVSEYGGPQ